MITVSHIIENIIKKEPFLEEAMSRGIINFSALARIIKPNIEKELQKSIQDGAVLMALKRFSIKIKEKLNSSQTAITPLEIIVRSNLINFTVANSDYCLEKICKFISLAPNKNQYFIAMTHGIFETGLTVSSHFQSLAEKTLKGEVVLSKLANLSAISLKLPKENIFIHGLYYSILKLLAWEKINLIDVVSTNTEFTVIVENQYVDRAFAILKTF